MTVATFLRIGLVVQVGTGFALARWLLPDSFGWLALPIGLAIPLVGTGLVLAFEFVVGAATDPRTPPLPLAKVVAVWWTETEISTRMFSFSQPFSAGFAEPVLVNDPARPAVLLVHGYLCNRAVWRALLDSGRLAGCNVATINLEPIFGPIERYGEVLRDAVEKLRAASGAQQVVLIGHSMGGLAIRAYLRQCGDAAVAKVITLATPHHGTVFGALGAGANSKQMAVGSAFILDLVQSLSPALVAKFLCVGTRDDNLIVPRSSPLLSGARQILLERVGHLALTEDPRAWQVLHEELNRLDTTAYRPGGQRVIDSAM